MRSTFAVRETASPLCRETQSLGQQMLNAPLGINGLKNTNHTAPIFEGEKQLNQISIPINGVYESFMGT